MKIKIVKKYKSEKGSTTIFVTVSMIFFLIIVIGMYFSVSRSLSKQNADINQIEKNYEMNIEQIYQEKIEKIGYINIACKNNDELLNCDVNINIYSDENCTNLVKQVCYKSGTILTVQLREGKYYLKCEKSLDSYIENTEIIPVEVIANQTAEVTFNFTQESTVIPSESDPRETRFAEVGYAKDTGYAGVNIKLRNEYNVTAGVGLSVYKVAEVSDENQNLTYCEGFEELEGILGDGFKLNQEGIERIKEISSSIDAIILINNPAPNFSKVSDENAEFRINGLSKGLWLFKFKYIKSGQSLCYTPNLWVNVGNFDETEITIDLPMWSN